MHSSTITCARITLERLTYSVALLLMHASSTTLYILCEGTQPLDTIMSSVPTALSIFPL